MFLGSSELLAQCHGFNSCFPVLVAAVARDQSGLTLCATGQRGGESLDKLIEAHPPAKKTDSSWINQLRPRWALRVNLC
jgi:hypothetical protein